MGVNQNTTVVFPVPIEFMQAFGTRQSDRAKAVRPQPRSAPGEIPDAPDIPPPPLTSND